MILVTRSLSRVLAAVMLFSSAAAADGIRLDFTNKSGDTRQWLRENGFVFKRDEPAAQIKYQFEARGMSISTLKPATSVVARSLTESEQVKSPAKLIVTWGVGKYPPGASWDNGTRREAIMIAASFGEDRTDLPRSSPYFIGFFLCKDGQLNAVNRGLSFPRTGRYICVGSPAEGAETTSTIDLADAFHKAFGSGRDVPPVTGIGFETDTTGMAANTTSSAWIKTLHVARR